MTELDILLGDSLESVDELIGKIEKMKITKKEDKDVMGLISSMKSLSVVSKDKKLDTALKKIKKHKKIIARRYKSLSGKKQKVTKKQIEDAFDIMDKLKKGGTVFKKYTVPQLKKLCKKKGIKGYSKLRKADLLKKVFD